MDALQITITEILQHQVRVKHLTIQPLFPRGFVAKKTDTKTPSLQASVVNLIHHNFSYNVDCEMEQEKHISTLQ